MKSSSAAFQAWEYRQGGWHARTVHAPAEQPLTLYLNGQEWVTLLASPHEPLALALGYLANEGVVRTPEEVALARVCGQGRCVDVWLQHSAIPPRPRVRTSGCGRGLTQEDPAQADLSPVPRGGVITPAAVFALLKALQQGSVRYAQSGGLHAAGLGTPEGRLRWLAEDVGRHNAVDRVRGLAWLAGSPTAGLVLVTTGRISAEMALKAVRMGCPVVASRTAATARAVALARRWGVTLIAYARARRLRVYTHPERLHPAPA